MTEALPPLVSAALLAAGAALAAANAGTAIGHGLVATALLVLLALSSTGIGRVALGLMRLDDLSEGQRTLIGCTLGLGFYALAVFALAAVGLLGLVSVLALVAFSWIVGFTQMREVVLSVGPDRALLRERPVLATGVLACLAAVLWTAWVPPHQYDSLVYHLPLAEAYARTGSLAPLGHLLYSHFPQNAELLFSMGLLLGSPLVPQLLSWLALALSVAWVFEMGKREIPLTAALLACLMTAGHTAVMLLSATTYVESFVMLWVTAAVLSLLRWEQIAAVEPSRRSWLALSAMFAGLAAGTKLTALVCPALLLIALTARAARRRSWGESAFFAALAGAAVLPWFLKDWLFVGNPVYPFFADDAAARGYFAFLTGYRHPPEDLLAEFAAFPFLAATGNPRYGGGMDALGTPGWGLLVAAAPTALWAASRNRWLRWIVGYCAAHWLVWLATGTVLRFLTALVPLASLAAAAGLACVWDACGPRARACLVGGVALLVGVNLWLFLSVHALVGSERVLLGLDAPEEWLARRLDYYPCARWASERLPKDARVLVWGDQRGFYLARAHATTSPMAPNPHMSWADQASGPDELARLLRERGGFTHVLVVPREGERLAGYPAASLTARARVNLVGLEATRLEPLFAGPGCRLGALR